VIYLFLLLLRIVAFLEGPQKIASFVVVFGLIAFSILKRVDWNRANMISKYNVYSLLLVLAILLHGFIFGHIFLRDVAVLLTFWIWFVFTQIYFKDKSIEKILRYLLITFLVYNIANYLFYMLYYSDQQRGVNSIMGMFGVFGYRIYFPLSSGANIFTSQLGLNALIALYFIKTSPRKIINIGIYGFYIFMLVLADSRLILFFTIMFSFFYWISFKKTIYYLKKYWLGLSILLLLFMYVFYGTTLFDSIKRPGERSGEAFTRIDIIGEAIKVIFSDLRILFGYGINGFEANMADAASKTFENERLQTAHNFIFQTMIDFGVIGILVVLAFVFKLLRKLIHLKSYIVTILMVMILLMGTTESIPTFYSFEPTLFFIALVSLILVKHEREVPQLS
jgi:hypothetical protein